MSIYSTLHLTESKAKALLFDHHFGHLTHQEMEAQLDELLAPRLNNVIIVSDDATNNDDALV